MLKLFTLVLAAGTAASLASCSKSNYAFTSTAPAYLGSEKMKTEVPATESKVTYMEEPATATLPTPRRATAHAVKATARYATKTKTASSAAVATVPVMSAEVSTIASTSYTRAERKTIRHQVKQIIASHNSTTAEGKSQLTAVLLCFFLGGLGIHDFYMGKVGKGIIQIILSLLVVGFILVIIDFVRLLTGDLKPKDGDWAKKL